MPEEESISGPDTAAAEPNPAKDTSNNVNPRNFFT